jgi:hypothetical protein
MANPMKISDIFCKLLCTTVLAAGFSGPTAAAGFTLAGSILVEPQQAVAYLTDPSGHLHAVDLENGRSTWTSRERALPIQIVQDQLIALASVEQFGMGMLLVIERSTGSVMDRIAFDLPERVSAELSAKPHRRFEISATSRPDAVRLFWRYQSKPLRGQWINESAENGDNSASDMQEGALDLTLSSTGNYVVPVRGAVSAPPVVGPNVAPANRLPGLLGRQFGSVDAAHILLSSPVDHPDFGTLNRWELYERQSGVKLGALDSHYAFSEFLVQGQYLLYFAQPIAHRAEDGSWVEQGARLDCYDLKRGKSSWNVAALDLEYRGPMPP